MAQGAIGDQRKCPACGRIFSDQAKWRDHVVRMEPCRLALHIRKSDPTYTYEPNDNAKDYQLTRLCTVDDKNAIDKRLSIFHNTEKQQPSLLIKAFDEFIQAFVPPETKPAGPGRERTADEARSYIQKRVDGYFNLQATGKAFTFLEQECTGVTPKYLNDEEKVALFDKKHP